MNEGNRMAKRILHVDNEPDILKAVKAILESEGYEVDTAAGGKACLKLLETKQYDLILLDIMMPDISGWDVFTRIMKTNPGQRVVFLSALEATPERIAALKNSGLADYITKPFDLEAFVTRIKQLVGA